MKTEGWLFRKVEPPRRGTAKWRRRRQSLRSWSRWPTNHPRRSDRAVPRNRAKLREAMQSLEDATTTTRRGTNDTTRTTALKGTRALGSGSGTNGQAEAGKIAQCGRAIAGRGCRFVVCTLSSAWSGQTHTAHSQRRVRQELLQFATWG